MAKSKTKTKKADQTGAAEKTDRDRVDSPAEDLGISSGDTVDRASIDALDAGAPMLGGDPSEPQGPEDALGEGDKRGDYSGRQPEGTTHYESRAIEGGGGLVENKDGGLDNSPRSELVEQNPRVEEVGDVPGKKGGVETAAESR